MLDRKLNYFFKLLTDEICLIHSLWYEYEALFNKSEERIKLLNSFSGPTFLILQDLLWKHVILKISAITDEDKNRSDLNISLKGLISLMKTRQYCVHEINEIHERLDKELSNLIKHRNKHLAHNDYNYSKNSYAKLDQYPIESAKIRNCLMLIADIRNKAALSMNQEAIYLQALDDSFEPEQLIYKIQSYNALSKTKDDLEIWKTVSRDYPIKNGS